VHVCRSSLPAPPSSAGLRSPRARPSRPGSVWVPLPRPASAVIIVALVVFLQSLSGSALAQDVGDSADMLAALIAGLACVRAARRGGVEARGWALLAVGMLVWAAAGALWAYYGLTRAHSYPFPSVADAGFLGQGYSADRTTAGQGALQGRCVRGRSMLGGWPPPPGGLGGTRFGCGLATSSR